MERKISKIGILGGALNPPHFGHLILAETALKKLNLEKIIFLPSGVPPLKKEKMPSAKDRFLMTKLLIERRPYFEVSDYEIRKKKKCFTIETLKFFRKKLRNCQIFWLIGEDSLREIIEGKWKGDLKILDLAQFIVFTRSWHQFNLKKLPKKFKEKSKKAFKKIIKVNLNIPISATKIRERIRKGKNLTSLVPEKVLKYIKEKKLYTTPNMPRKTYFLKKERFLNEARGASYIDFEKIPPHLRFTQKKIREITGKKIKEIRNYFKKYHFKKAVIGVSGGIDSALAATLAVKALGPKNVYFLRMPYLGISSKESLILAEKLARNLKLPKENLITIPINKQVDLSWKILKKFKGGNIKIRKGNLMARERMGILFDLSAVKRAIVIGSEDKSEERLGYFTIGGDRVSGVEPINNLYKIQVYQIANFFREITDEILKRAPSPELWKSQTDEGEIGAFYLEIDTVLSAIEDLKISKKEIEKKFRIKKSKIDLILRKYQKAKGKRNLPYILKS